MKSIRPAFLFFFHLSAYMCSVADKEETDIESSTYFLVNIRAHIALAFGLRLTDSINFHKRILRSYQDLSPFYIDTNVSLTSLYLALFLSLPPSDSVNTKSDDKKKSNL